jgi:hypothetical protein
MKIDLREEVACQSDLSGRIDARKSSAMMSTKQNPVSKLKTTGPARKSKGTAGKQLVTVVEM